MSSCLILGIKELVEEIYWWVRFLECRVGKFLIWVGMSIEILIMRKGINRFKGGSKLCWRDRKKRVLCRRSRLSIHDFFIVNKFYYLANICITYTFIYYMYIILVGFFCTAFTNKMYKKFSKTTIKISSIDKSF